MKQRVISAVVGLAILAVVICFYDTAVFTIAIALISIIATYELLNATKLIQYRPLTIIATGFSLTITFAQSVIFRPFVPLAVFVLAVAFFLFMLRYYNRLSIEKMFMGLMFSIFIPLFFSCAVYLRNAFGDIKGLYYLFLALGSAWFCDTGAYFSGYFFGKHKMAPTISPKKTVEGAIGGLITATVLNLLLAFVFTKVFANSATPIHINYLVLGFISPIFALLGMLGDLLASVIKRQSDVKDYGHIMPGHGGVMDRFDSVLLTLPAVYLFVTSIPLAS